MSDPKHASDRKPAERAEEAKPAARASILPGAKALNGSVLLQRFGRSAVTVIEHFVEGLGPEVLVTDGRRLGTARIVRDGSKIVVAAGNALAKASDDQQALLPMVTAQFLSALATAITIAEEAQGSLDKARRSAATSKRSSVARAMPIEKRAKNRRKILRAALVTAACGDAEWISRVDIAAGTGVSPSELSESLTGLVAVGRDLRKKLESNGIEHKLTDAYLSGILRLAEQAGAGVPALDPAITPGAVGQGDVKRADGVCLWFLKRLVDAFDAAHEADPSIERLKVYSLRSVFRRASKKKTAKAAAPVVPVAAPTH